MNCPSDGTTLLMSERQGIEIDYCPQCRGIWLDRGELDKILERAKAESEGYAAPGAPAQPPAAPAQQTPAAPAQPYGAPPQQYGAPQYGGPQYDAPRYDDRRHDDRRDERYDDRRSHDPRYGDPRYRKKKSPFDFLGDIFD